MTNININVININVLLMSIVTQISHKNLNNLKSFKNQGILYKIRLMPCLYCVEGEHVIETTLPLVHEVVGLVKDHL